VGVGVVERERREVMEEMEKAFKHYRYRVASRLLEGETDAHWRRAFKAADELVSYNNFCAGWEASRDAMTSAQARTK